MSIPPTRKIRLVPLTLMEWEAAIALSKGADGCKRSAAGSGIQLDAPAMAVLRFHPTEKCNITDSDFGIIER
jgi:hypothetical protein